MVLQGGPAVSVVDTEGPSPTEMVPLALVTALEAKVSQLEQANRQLVDSNNLLATTIRILAGFVEPPRLPR